MIACNSIWPTQGPPGITDALDSHGGGTEGRYFYLTGENRATPRNPPPGLLFSSEFFSIYFFSIYSIQAFIETYISVIVMAQTNGHYSSNPVPIWIDATPRPIARDRLFDVVSANSGNRVYQAQSANAEEALAAADSSYKAWIGGWKDELYEKRRDLLLRVADIYDRRMAEIVQYQIEETSCPQPFAEFNVRYAAQHLRETASCIAALRGSVPQVTDKNVFSVTIKEPIGPVMVIVP